MLQRQSSGHHREYSLHRQRKHGGRRRRPQEQETAWDNAKKYEAHFYCNGGKPGGGEENRQPDG